MCADWRGDTLTFLLGKLKEEEKKEEEKINFSLTKVKKTNCSITQNYGQSFLSRKESWSSTERWNQNQMKTVNQLHHTGGRVDEWWSHAHAESDRQAEGGRGSWGPGSQRLLAEGPRVAPRPPGPPGVLPNTSVDERGGSGGGERRCRNCCRGDGDETVQTLPSFKVLHRVFWD